jgi:hypothetical protein
MTNQTTTTRTYRNGEHTITLQGGKIVDSTSDYFRSGPDFRIGSRIKVELLGRFGFRLVKTPVQYDAWGQKVR